MRNCDDAYTREYLDIMDRMGGDEAGRRRAWKRMGEGTSTWDGGPTPLSFVPRLFGMQTRGHLERTAKMTYRILCKAIERFRTDEAFRREFRLDPRVEELALLPRPYAEPLPYARVDYVLDGETGRMRAIEFNTDASSGMNENREALAAIRTSETFERFAEGRVLRDDVALQFEGWVVRFKALWSEARAQRASGEDAAEEGGASACAAALGSAPAAPAAATGATDPAAPAAVEGPRMAIVACLDSPDPDIGELEVYRKLFEAAGMPCSVFDVRELDFDGTRLRGRRALAGQSDVPVDCIWRWCIVVDLLAHWDEVQPFLAAVRTGAAVLVGSFATQIAHDKQLFAVLHRSSAAAWLDEDERRFVAESIPFTAFADDPSVDWDAVKRDPARWVLKPTDWYESKHVVAGRDCTPAEWAQAVDDARAVCATCAMRADAATEAGAVGAGADATGAADAGAEAELRKTAHAAAPGPVAPGAPGIAALGSPFILQEFCAPGATPAVALRGADGDFTAAPQAFGNILGLYLHCGEFAGVYVRQGPHAVIGSAREGLVSPVIWVDDAGEDAENAETAESAAGTQAS